MKRIGTPKIEKTCKNGHIFFETPGFNTCAICEISKDIPASWWKNIGAAARRALQNKKWDSLEILKHKTEHELLKLHGVGPKAVKIITEALNDLI